MRPVFRRLLPLLVLPLAFGCENGSFEPTGAGTMSIMLTDAPGDFENAIVTIDRIELLGDGQDDVILLDDPVTVDLLDLQNEVMVLAGETPVPGGTYSELRLVISEGLITVEQEDGSVLVYASSDEFAQSEGFASDGRLQMPSFGQSGLKIKLPHDEAVVDGDDNAVLIDFKVADSFGHQAGNSGLWVLHPVIHATGFTTTGSARLEVVLGEDVTLPIIEETQVTLAMISAILDRDDDLIPVLLTETETEGTWAATFHFLPPGEWTVDLGLEGLLLTTDPELPITFNVVSGQTDVETVTITAASLDEE
jgi:hypothetical protein